jgi:hypothetical protein
MHPRYDDRKEPMKGCRRMFKFYLGISIMCALFAVLAIFFSDKASTVTSIFLGMTGAFMAIAFVTSGKESRW